MVSFSGQENQVRVFQFRQRCGWRVSSSGIWHRVPDIWRQLTEGRSVQEEFHLWR